MSEGAQAKPLAVVGLGLEDRDRAKAIVATARRFAGPSAELRLIHVHRLRQMALMDYTYIEPPERVADELAREMEELEAIGGGTGEVTSFDVLVGNPVDAILAALKGADLLVIGRSHLGLLSRLLEGSVESRLAHEASCPVLIVP